MAIAFGAAGTRLLVGTAATSWAVPYPSGITSGQLLVLHVVTNGGTVTAPGGWTEIYNVPSGSALVNPRGGMWIKVADGSETGTLAVALTSSTGNAAMFRYTGVDTSTPQDATATTFLSTSNAATLLPAITTVTANTVLVYGNAGNSATVTMTAPGTERVDHGALGGTGSKAGALYDEAVAATGSTGTRTITMSANRAGWGVMAALRPGAAGTTLSPELIASTAAVAEPTVTPGAVTVQPELIAATSSVAEPTVTPGAVTVQPELIAATSSVAAPTLTGGANPPIVGTFLEDTVSSSSRSITVPAGVTATMTAMIAIGTGSSTAVVFTLSKAGATFVKLDEQNAVNTRCSVWKATGLVAGDTITVANTGGAVTVSVQHIYTNVWTPGTLAAAIRGASQATTTTGSVTPAAGQQVLVVGIERTTATPTVVTSVTSSGGETVDTIAYTEGPTVQTSVGFFTFTASAAAARTATITYDDSSGNGYAAAVLLLATQTLTPQTIEPTATVGLPTLAQPQSLSPELIAATSSVSAPTLTPGPVTVAPTVIASTASVGTPTLTVGAVTVSPATIAATASVGAPQLTLTVNPTVVASTASVGQPTLAPGAVTVSPAVVASTATVGEPVVSTAGGPVTVTPAVIASTAAVPAPTVTPGPVTVAPTTVASTGAVYEPTVTPGLVTVEPITVASTASVDAPTVILLWQVITPDTIAALSQVMHPLLTVRHGRLTTGEPVQPTILRAGVPTQPDDIGAGEPVHLYGLHAGPPST